MYVYVCIYIHIYTSLFDMFVTYIHIIVYIYIYLLYIYICIFMIYTQDVQCVHIWDESKMVKSGNHHIYKQSSRASSTGSSSSSFKIKKRSLATATEPPAINNRAPFGGFYDWTKIHRKTMGKPHQHHCSRESNCHWALGIEGRHVEQVQQNFDDNQNLPLKKSSAKWDREFGRRSSFNVPSTRKSKKWVDLLTKWVVWMTVNKL